MTDEFIEAYPLHLCHEPVCPSRIIEHSTLTPERDATSSVSTSLTTQRVSAATTPPSSTPSTISTVPNTRDRRGGHGGAEAVHPLHPLHHQHCSRDVGRRVKKKKKKKKRLIQIHLQRQRQKNRRGRQTVVEDTEEQTIYNDLVSSLGEMEGKTRKQRCMRRKQKMDNEYM